MTAVVFVIVDESQSTGGPLSFHDRCDSIVVLEPLTFAAQSGIKDTIAVHGVSYGIPKLETYLQGKEAEGLIADSYLVVAPFRAANQDTESFVVFYTPSFDLYSENATKESNLEVAALLQKACACIKNICVKMVTLIWADRPPRSSVDPSPPRPLPPSRLRLAPVPGIRYVSLPFFL